MPQPDEVARLAEQLIALFRDADTEIARLAAEAATEPNGARRRARLAEMRRTVDAHLAQLEADSSAWLSRAFPAIYELGGEQGARSIGDEFSWTQIHADAVQQLAGDTFDDVLAATGFVRDDVKSWVREQARRQTGLSLIEGRTAQQAARELAKAAAGDAVDILGGPIGVIRYADGSYRTMADYADMLLRTKTAQAFNSGTLNTLTAAGVEWCEVLDGMGCGWTSHSDGDKANGTVRTAKDCYEHSLSHPRCRRSFIGRLDVTSKEQAVQAKPSTTPAQDADQAAAEKRRAEALANRRKARERSPRVPRPSRDTVQRRPRRKPRAETAHPQVPPPGFTPTGHSLSEPAPAMTSRTDAEAWLTAKWGQTSGGVDRVFNFVGCGDDYVIAAAERIDELFQAYPQVADRIEHVGSFKSRGLNEDAWGVSQRNIRFLLVNERITPDMDWLVKTNQKLRETRVFASADPMMVLNHEFGHHVHYLAETRAWVAEHGGQLSSAFRYEAWLKRELDPILAETLGLPSTAALTGKATRDRVTAGLSKYATSNYYELCAEAWTEYTTMGDAARPLAKAIGRWMEGAVG